MSTARRGLAMWVLAVEAMDVEMVQAAMKVRSALVGVVHLRGIHDKIPPMTGTRDGFH